MDLPFYLCAEYFADNLGRTLFNLGNPLIKKIDIGTD